MSDLLITTLLADGGGDFWQTAEMLWQSPDYRPVMIAAVGVGGLIGLVAFPFGRRLVLALRPRAAVRDADRSG